MAEYYKKFGQKLFSPFVEMRRRRKRRWKMRRMRQEEENMEKEAEEENMTGEFRNQSSH